MAGLLGSGRSETARAIFGADTTDSGELVMAGQPVRFASPRDAIRRSSASCRRTASPRGSSPT